MFPVLTPPFPTRRSSDRVGAGQAGLLAGAAIAFGHGLALAALSRQARRRMAVLALAAILAGTLPFSGGLVVAHFTGAAARTAPFGGSLLIGGWLGRSGEPRVGKLCVRTGSTRWATYTLNQKI